jgi:hypothetical protein
MRTRKKRMKEERKECSKEAFAAFIENDVRASTLPNTVLLLSSV